MKAIMSKAFREIISDPIKTRELNKALSRTNKKRETEGVEAKIGGKNYKIRFVSPQLKNL